MYEDVIARALDEDLGEAGDLTSEAVVGPDALVSGALVARRPGRIAGLEVAGAVFAAVDQRIEVTYHQTDGDEVGAGTRLATVTGRARSVLTGERTALNLLGHLSGVATATAAFVARVVGTNARIADTRKTTPGLRALEKYAVRMGGGINHRFGLSDAVMIKDNHLIAAGGVLAALEAARRRVGHLVKIEVEVTTLAQLEEVLEAGADVVLLDNMDLATMVEAVRLVGGRLVVEASGGITLDNVAEVARTGVDVISVGWITHSAPALDVALDLEG
ncbi:MAG TPA: carboxylating nicotinate-nucleotide diphosphorylase [Acidimicrobiia bacterium]|nr:carboxylating nicotinate-nucleotide diphosphorylase [Acidimicrobiia bacterium]